MEIREQEDTERRDSSQKVRNSKKLKEKRKSRRDPEVTGRKTDGENRADEEVKPAHREKEREGREKERQREKQMVAEKRQIETHWEDNTGTASEAQRGGWKAEKCQRKKGGGG